MNNILLVIMVIIFIISMLCCIKLHSYKDKLAKTMTCLFVISILSLVSYAVKILFVSEKTAYIAHSMSYIIMLWFSLALIEYVQVYTTQEYKSKAIRIPILILCIFNTINMLLNPVFKHVFLLEPITSGEKIVSYVRSNTTILLVIHLATAFVLIIFAIIALAYKYTKSAKLYRPKYIYPFWATVFVSVVDSVWGSLFGEIEISAILFSVMGLLLFYFAYIHTPKQIVEKSISFVVTELKNGIICFDAEGRCVYVNAIVKKQLKNSKDVIKLEQYYNNIITEKNSDNLDTFSWEERQEESGEVHYYIKTYNKMYDEYNVCIGWFIKIDDRTEQMNNYRQEKYKANHDVLTGIYNKARFYEKAKKLIDNNETEDYLMISTDIKDFKVVNELYGTEKGDEILCAEAEIIKGLLSDKSVYGRITGDKFAICVPKSLYNDKILTDALENFRKQFETNDFRLHIYVGIYEITDRNEKISVMYDKADMAIKKIYDDYHNHIAYYDNKLLNQTVEEKSIIDAFDKALENEEFCIYIQPQFTADGKVIGGEALVRWIKQDKGLVPPGAFIPVFEKSNLITKLDCFVWEEAVKKLAEWGRIGIDYHLSVNISGRDFYYADVYKVITDLTDKYKIDNAKLKLEITEAVLVNENPYYREVISKLQAAGFEVEIDDFGSGYSSLNMLKDIYADVIKIDMGFLRKTRNEEKSHIILDSIISLAHKLDVPVICEGVETEKQLNFLNSLGCEQYQGYYFSKPIPVDDFEGKYVALN